MSLSESSKDDDDDAVLPTFFLHSIYRISKIELGDI